MKQLSSRLLVAVVISWGSLLPGTPAFADTDPPPITADLSDPPLVGYKDSLLYLRDPRNLIRLYPHAQLDLDMHSFVGPGADTLSASTAGVDLAPRFLVRHARFDLGGELWERIDFDGGIELVANPAIDGSRVSESTVVALADAWAKLDAGRGLGLWLGVFQAPFSLENSTAATQLPMMERNVAVRGFIAPGGGKALGAALSGRTAHTTLAWDVGAFGAETISPTDFEQHFDGIGRIYWRPFARDWSNPVQGLHIGASARVGSRDPRDLSGDAPAITTGQGFALWRPTRLDGSGNLVHVIPASLQWGAGLEIVVPWNGFVLRGEAFWMSKETREAIDGFQTVSSLRSGGLSGVGWYGELSWWPLQMLKLLPSLALPRPAPDADHLEVARVAPISERRGLEVALAGAGINASYSGASRGGSLDPSVATAISIYQAGIALSYWQSANLRITADANTYVTPESGSGNGSVVVPGNLATAGSNAHWIEELGARVSVMF
jgi:hypothetical protein